MCTHNVYLAVCSLASQERGSFMYLDLICNILQLRSLSCPHFLLYPLKVNLSLHIFIVLAVYL